MTTAYLPKISRRTTLQWLAAVVGGFVVPQRSLADRLVVFKTTAKGYGSDPSLNHPVVPWERMMTEHQLQLTAVLADLLLPATSAAPAPSVLGIPDFVNEWVSAPYPEQLSDRPLFLDGLASLDENAKRRWGKGILEITDAERQEILDLFIAAWRKRDQSAAQHTFFYRFRYVVLGAYYTTSEGYKDIGYLGNVPLQSYPAATDQERAILEREFNKLGFATSG